MLFQEKEQETVKFLAQVWVSVVVLAVVLGSVMVLGMVPQEAWSVMGTLLEKGWALVLALPMETKMVLAAVVILSVVVRVTQWAFRQLGAR